MENTKSKKPFIIGGIIAALLITAAVVVIFIGALIIGGLVISSSKDNAKIGEVEDKIFAIDFNDIYNCEDEIYAVYQEYDALSDKQKRKIENRESLINAYKQVEKAVEARKEAASNVDELINAIDYSNWFAEAESVSTAVVAYNKLDTKERAYLKNESALSEAYNYVTSNPVTIDASNFNQVFTIQYVVGEKSNYGQGTTINQDGYIINWDDGTITPDYDVDSHNDYATPVYVYVQSKYPSLTSECSFYINLHQTYNGILSSDEVYEYELQSRTISYSSSMDIGEYVIYVENKETGGSIWDALGLSYDWNDMLHNMNPFDVSRVKISDVQGYIAYPSN